MTGRPALAMGCSEGGERLAHESPYRAPVPWAEVVFGCPWTSPVETLRGAVVRAVGGDLAHVDYHAHLPDGTTRQTRPTVLYRVGPPRVWLYGPRAHDRLTELARVTSLLTPSGRTVPVDDLQISSGVVDCGIDVKHWHRYESVTPYFPSQVAYVRRPREAGHEQDAWASQVLQSSIRRFFEELEVAGGQHPVSVHLVEVQHERCTWRSRREATVWGFRARFLANAVLPSGFALGQHVSEGWGEVRRC